MDKWTVFRRHRCRPSRSVAALYPAKAMRRGNLVGSVALKNVCLTGVSSIGIHQIERKGGGDTAQVVWTVEMVCWAEKPFRGRGVEEEERNKRPVQPGLEPEWRKFPLCPEGPGNQAYQAIKLPKTHLSLNRSRVSLFACTPSSFNRSTDDESRSLFLSLYISVIIP